MNNKIPAKIVKEYPEQEAGPVQQSQPEAHCGLEGKLKCKFCNNWIIQSKMKAHLEREHPPVPVTTKKRAKRVPAAQPIAAPPGKRARLSFKSLLNK